MKLVRWALLLFSLYVLVAMVRFYAVHPDQLSHFDRSGVLRLSGTSIIAIGCYMLGAAIVRERRCRARCRPLLRSGEPRSDDGNGAPLDTIHPFKTAFRRHPVAFALVVFFLFLLPLLIPLASPGNSQLFDAGYWLVVLAGEVLAAIVFALAWRRAGRPTEDHRAPPEG